LTQETDALRRRGCYCAEQESALVHITVDGEQEGPMDDTVSPLGAYITGPVAADVRQRCGPGVAVRWCGVWRWPALSDDEIDRDPWL
jgi:hypothetical protein